MLETIITNFAIGALYLMIGGTVFFMMLQYLLDALEDMMEMSVYEFVALVVLCSAIGYAVS